MKEQTTKARTINALCPTFFRGFFCTGPECTDNCCHTWQIEIDKEHYLRYRGEKDQEFRILCAQTLRRKKKSSGKEAYANLMLDERGYCGFQDEDGGCRLYRILGEDALSQTCAMYPRRKAEFVPGRKEVSLSMSCEEVVRVGVLQQERIEFEETELTNENKALICARSAGIGSGGAVIMPPVYGEYLRRACIRLMQCRRYTVAERILSLILMLKRIDYLTVAREEEHIWQEIENFLKNVETGGLTGFFNQLDYHREAHLSALQIPVGHLLSGRQGTVRQELLRFLAPYLDPDLEGELCAGSRAMDHLLEQIRSVGDPFLGQHSLWLENYFVNYMFSAMFPFLYRVEKISFEQHAVFLADQYALLRIAASVLPTEAVSDQKRMTQCIVHTARLSQHGDLGQDMNRLFQTLGVRSMAHAVYLLR